MRHLSAVTAPFAFRTARPSVLVASVAALVPTSIAQAVGPFLWVSDTSRGLGVVDTQTGSVSMIGLTSVVMTDIAFDRDENLWGISFTNLYRIDKTTAATTLVGSTGVPGANALVFGPTGTLYAAGSDARLYSLNTATGAGTNLGTIGFASAGDLAFNGGELYLSEIGASRLVQIALGPTVSGTVVGSIGFANVYGLATAENSVLYGTTGTRVIAVNTLTGAGALVADYGGHGLGTAGGTAFTTEAPAPSSAFVLGIAGLLANRRRRASRSKAPT